MFYLFINVFINVCTCIGYVYKMSYSILSATKVAVNWTGLDWRDRCSTFYLNRQLRRWSTLSIIRCTTQTGISILCIWNNPCLPLIVFTRVFMKLMHRRCRNCNARRTVFRPQYAIRGRSRVLTLRIRVRSLKLDYANESTRENRIDVPTERESAQTRRRAI